MALNSVKDGNKKWVSSEWPRGAVARWINALQHLPCSVLLQPVIIFLFLLHLTTFFSRPRNSCLLARLIYSSSSQFPIELFLRCNSFQFIPAPSSIDRDRDAYDESKTFFFHFFYSDYLDVLFTGQRQRQLVTDFFIIKMFYIFTIFSFIHLLTYFYGWLHWFISLVQLVCNSCYHSQFTQQSSFFIFSVNCEFVS